MANIDTTTVPPDPNAHTHGLAPQPQNTVVYPATTSGFQIPQQTPVLQNEPAQRAFSAEDIERARTEERSKLYGDMQAMQEELKRLAEAETARQQAAADADRLRKEEEDRKHVEETDTKTLLQQREQEWSSKFQTLEQQIAARDAMMEKERELAALESFKSNALLEHGDDIMPQLRDFVRGNTPEEILQSIEAMKNRTAEILGSVQEAFSGQQQQTLPFQGGAGQPPFRTPSPTGAPSYDPSALVGGQRTITDAEIRAMSLEEYAKVRNDLHTAARNHVQRYGPYGNGR